MSDDQQGTPRPADETQPVRPEGAAALPQPPATTAAPAASEAYEPAPAARRGFRERFGSLRRTQGGDRSYGLAALIASALAGIIVGGLGLTAVHAIAHDGPGDRGRWMEQRGPTGPRQGRLRRSWAHARPHAGRPSRRARTGAADDPARRGRRLQRLGPTPGGENRFRRCGTMAPL